MKRVGMILFGIGCIGLLIGGSGLDGPTFASSEILTAASFASATVGYKIYKISERGERNKASEEINTRPKEATFSMWIESCRMDESV